MKGALVHKLYYTGGEKGDEGNITIIIIYPLNVTYIPFCHTEGGNADLAATATPPLTGIRRYTSVAAWGRGKLTAEPVTRQRSRRPTTKRRLKTASAEPVTTNLPMTNEAIDVSSDALEAEIEDLGTWKATGKTYILVPTVVLALGGVPSNEGKARISMADPKARTAGGVRTNEAPGAAEIIACLNMIISGIGPKADPTAGAKEVFVEEAQGNEELNVDARSSQLNATARGAADLNWDTTRLDNTTEGPQKLLGLAAAGNGARPYAGI